jgi:hypothetical protein
MRSGNSRTLHPIHPRSVYASLRAVSCEDWLAEQSEFELPVPVLELSDEQLSSMVSERLN